jgi:hypothetical protein
MTSQLLVPNVGMELPGKQTLMVVPGGKTKLADAIVDETHGPAPSTGSKLVTELGGPVTDMFGQTKDVHWQGNFYGYGSEKNLQGSPDPEYNMNTRKLLYAYPVDEAGKPKPLDPDKGFRVFVMFDFLFWAEDPANKLGCASVASSAAKVDPSVKVPFWKTPMQVLHNWRWSWRCSARL